MNWAVRPLYIRSGSLSIAVFVVSNIHYFGFGGFTTYKGNDLGWATVKHPSGVKHVFRRILLSPFWIWRFHHQNRQYAGLCDGCKSVRENCNSWLSPDLTVSISDFGFRGFTAEHGNKLGRATVTLFGNTINNGFRRI